MHYYGFDHLHYLAVLRRLLVIKPVKCLCSSAVILVIVGLSFRDLRAEDITIRFIDGKTGTPLNIVHFELWGCKGFVGFVM